MRNKLKCQDTAADYQGYLGKLLLTNIGAATAATTRALRPIWCFYAKKGYRKVLQQMNNTTINNT